MPRVHEEAPTRVKLSHKSTDATLELAVQTTIEYDGLVLIDFQVTPRQQTRVERLAFEMPLRQQHARLVYQYRDRLFRAPGSLPKEGLARSFNPALWLGDEERGLQWFAESDRDWYLADAEKAIEIRQEGGSTVLRLNLVTKPIELKPGAKRTAGALPSLTYTFGLQATPVKLVTKDAWDYRTICTPVYNNQYALLTEQLDGRPGLDYYAEQGVKTVFLTISWTDTFGYPGCVGHTEELHRMVKACHARGMQLIVYLGSLFADQAPEFRAFVQDFGRWSSSRPYSCYPFPTNTPPGRTQMCYGTCAGSEWRDFIVAGAARLVREFGLDGFYLDGLGLVGPCHNHHHGCGYMRPDGTIGATYPFLAGRDLIRRLYHIVKSANPNGQIDLHPAAFWFSPTMTWATNTWDGETILGDLRSRAKRQGVHLLDYLPLDQFRVQFMGKPWGVPSEFLSYYVPYPYRRLLAMTLLHDVLIRPNSALGDLPFASSLWRLGDEFDRRGAEWIPYWRSSPYVTVEPQGAYVSLYRHPKNGVLAVVSNLAKEKAQVRVRIDLRKLGLPAKNVAIDPLSPGEAFPIKDGEIVLELGSVEWRILWLKPE